MLLLIARKQIVSPVAQNTQVSRRYFVKQLKVTKVTGEGLWLLLFASLILAFCDGWSQKLSCQKRGACHKNSTEKRDCRRKNGIKIRPKSYRIKNLPINRTLLNDHARVDLICGFRF